MSQPGSLAGGSRRWQDRLAQAPVVPSPASAPAEEAVLLRASDVEVREVQWLAEPYLPLGKPVLLVGDPGVGKTHLALKVAADVTRGAPPFGGACRGPARQGRVLVLSAEDDPADTLVPRLIACGADLDQVSFLRGKRAPGDARTSFVSLADADLLDRTLAELRPALVLVDPVQAHLAPGADMHRANDVRESLRVAADLGEKHGTTFLLIGHMSKGAQSRAMYRALGSIDFVAAVRSVLLVGFDPKDSRPPTDPSKRRVVAHSKSNLAVKGSSLAFELREGGVAWQGPCDLTDADLVASDPAPERRKEVDAAEALLRDVLADGPMSQKSVRSRAHAESITPGTLRRAKDRLGVEARAVQVQAPKSGTPPRIEWYWRLPGTPQDAQVSTLGADAQGAQEARSEHLGESDGGALPPAPPELALPGHAPQGAHPPSAPPLLSTLAPPCGHGSAWTGWQEHGCLACKAAMDAQEGSA